MTIVVFQRIAIGAFAVFYGCYFAKMFQQKRRGIQTDQMGRGKVGFVKLVEVATKAVAVLASLAGLAAVIAGESRGPTAMRIAGAVMSVLGTAAFVTAVWTMRDSWRAGVPETGQTELVTGGIFQMSRNPAFLGFDLLYVGTLLMFFSWLLCGLTAFAVLMFHLQIVNVEEDFLLAAFGAEYRQYKETVHRYIGRKR